MCVNVAALDWKENTTSPATAAIACSSMQQH
jgi:hypothetical protein